MLPCTDADTNTRVYTLVYDHHTDRHILTGTQIEEGAHTRPGYDTLPTNICAPDGRGVISTALTHSGVQRENRSSKKYRAISPLIEMFYCGKVSSGPAGIYQLKISGDAELKHHRVVLQPGKLSDKVRSNLGLWLSVDFTLDHALCMRVILRTRSIWILSSKS